MIAGYAWPQSVVAGGRVALHVSCSAARFDVEVVRQGAAEVRVFERAGLPGREHPVPADVGSRGCRWPVALEVGTEASWRPGLHLVRLRAGSEVAEAFFVVRPSRPASPRLLVLATSTWAAYGDWGGPSYYTGGTRSSLLRPLPKGFLERPAPERFRYARMAELRRPISPPTSARASRSGAAPPAGRSGSAASSPSRSGAGSTSTSP